MEHDVVPLGERHAPHNFEYADETARLAATITDSKWVNALALQLDDGSYWRVASVSPATWEPVVTPAWADITGKPSTFPPSTHSHAISDVTDLQDELDAKEPSITKATGYAKWTGSAWSFSNETYMQTSHDANAVTAAAISNWNTAFGWGNHATAGYTSNLGTVTAVAALTLGTSGTDVGSSVATGTTTPVITLNIPTASAANRGALSSADWSTFNGKQAALGFTAENAANKSTNATTDASSNTKYPSVKAIVDYAVSADASVLSSAATDATTKANAAQAAAIAASTPVSHLGSGGTAHANVVAAGAAGFMTGADKTKLDAITGANSGDETGARIATLHHAASTKSALVDADEVTGGNSASGFSLIRTTWADVKAYLKTYFDTLYQAAATYVTPTTLNNGSLPASVTTLAATDLTTTGNTVLGNATTDTLNVGNGGIIKDAAGNVGIGSSPTLASLFSSKPVTGGVSWGQVRVQGVIQSDVMNLSWGYQSVLVTQAAAFTLAQYRHFDTAQASIGAGSAITSQYGFVADATLVGATTNYGFYGNIPTAAGRYNFYAAGDAPNRFVGETLVIGPAGLGYGTGAGGTVTQATSRTTAVTLNKPTGAITLVSAAGSTSWQSFTVTNSIVTNGDVPNVVQKSGTDKYRIHVTNVANGSFQITYATTGGTTTEQPVFNFSIDKGSAT